MNDDRTVTIEDVLAVLHDPGTTVELRVLHTRRGTVSGYFTDPSLLAQAVSALDGTAPAVYVTLNPVDPTLLARAANHTVEYARYTTADQNIVRRRWILFDFDPIRPSGISSTDDEHQAALARAAASYGWLIKTGVPAASIVMADSGNGVHLLLRIDLPNDASSLVLVKRCLEAVALRWGDETVAVDVTTDNAARIVKLYGTMSAKGDDLPNRPHRRSALLVVPDVIEVVPTESVTALADLVPTTVASAPDRSGSQGAFDLDRWLTDHQQQVTVVAAGAWNGGRKWILNPCPWDPAHTNRAAFVVQFQSGAIAAGCHHNGCQGKDWHALRDVAEPGWRDRRVARVVTSQILSGSPADSQIHSAAIRDIVPAESILRFRTARDIAAAAPPAVPWRVYPWVADGTITEVDGKVKSAGKTTWVTHLVWAVVTGTPFMGHSVVQSPVVYLTEQPPASFRVALDRAGLSDREDVYVLYWRDATGIPWPKVVEETCQECRRRGAHLLVVDTLGQFSGIPGDSENDAGPAQAAMAPLQVAAADGLAILIARHERKSGGEVGESGRGSSAYAGTVDIVLSLRRAEGAVRPTIREIHSLSRFDDTPARLMIELTDGGYVALGTSESVAKQEAEVAILKAVPKDEGAAINTEDLIKAAGVKRTVGQEVIEDLYAQQRLTRLGAGKRGDPFKYWTPPPSGVSMPVRAAETVPSETLDTGHVAEGHPSIYSAAPRDGSSGRINSGGNGEFRPPGNEETPVTADDLPGVMARLGSFPPTDDGRQRHLWALAESWGFPRVALGPGESLGPGREPYRRFVESLGNNDDYIDRAIKALQAFEVPPQTHEASEGEQP